MSILKEGWDTALDLEGARDVKSEGDSIEVGGFDQHHPVLPLIDPIII